MASATGVSRSDQLLDAATVCFARRGFHATTVADISAEAGCSQGLLYRYFPGKQALIEALLQRQTTRAVAELATVPHARDPVAALRDLAARALAEQRETGALELETVAEAGRDSRLAEAVRRGLDQILAALTAALREGQASGMFDAALDAPATARCLTAIVDGLCYQQAVDPRFEASTQLAALDHLLSKLLHPPTHPTNTEGATL